MSVWVCVPSARPVEHVRQWAAKWRERGYKIALYFNESPHEWKSLCDTFLYPLSRVYDGYAKAVNALARSVLQIHPDCNWIVTGGDDVYPDPNHTADEIARECSEHFKREKYGPESRWNTEPMPGDTFGVMQPTGDRWPSDANCYVDRVCGSPWLGREFCLRINQGKGPLWPDYTHNFVDEELQNVALKYGVLWQRRDLIHYHDNWARARKLSSDCPDFLKAVTGVTAEGRAHWAKYKRLFLERKAAGFPGSEPL